MSAAERSALEARFGLTSAVQTDGTTWQYRLVDHSTTNIASLVGHELVADTHKIDRVRFRPTEVPWSATRIAQQSAAIGVIGGLLVLLGGRALRAWQPVRDWWRLMARPLTSDGRSTTASEADIAGPWLLARTPFGRVRAIEAELRQLAALRWLAGLVCFARTAAIVWTSVSYFDTPATGSMPGQTIVGLQILALVAAATVGFASPIVLPLLIVSYPSFDQLMQTETLGTRLWSLLLWLFFLSAAGSTRSVDAWLMRRQTIGAPIRVLYRIVGIPTAPQLQSVLFVFFAAYAVLNFGALIYHASDDVWRSGDLLRLLFTSSYLSRFWEMFREIERAFPEGLTALSRIGSAGQAVFQALMLPLLWFRWGSRFVIVWGALFFAMSLLTLQLSYLPPLELILWTALFHRPATARDAVVRAPVASRPTWVSRAVIGVALAALTLFAASSLPVYAPLPSLRQHVDTLFLNLGLETPNVFNRSDVGMGNAWPVIYREQPDVLLPYHGPDGERLAWVQWSDVFYFGNSLPWRRHYRGPASLDHESPLAPSLLRVGLFDHRRSSAARSTYRVEYYVTDGTDLRLSVDERFVRRLIRVDRFVCAGTDRNVECTWRADEARQSAERSRQSEDR